MIGSYFTGRKGKGIRIKDPYKLQLPRLPGLRIRRGVTTGKFGKQDVIVDATGRVYGVMSPNADNIIGNPTGVSPTYLTITRKKKGGGGGSTTPGSGNGTPAAGGGGGTTPDEFASYEKDYPWIASYLRSLKSDESAFNTRYKDVIQPGVSAGLTALGKIGEGIANTYGGQVGTSAQQPGYVSNIYNAAASLTPAQVANGMGGASSVFDPNSVAARQGLAGAQSAEAQANARYRSLMAGLSPVSTAQGILGNVASQAAAISKSYADKRLSERVKLDQWIAEQKAAKEDRLIKQQYNMALLGLKQDQLTLSQNQYNLDVQKANSAGVKTDTELAAAGFVRFDPNKIGPKNRGKAQQRAVTSREGNMWWKPGGGGSGGSSGSGGPTAKQGMDLIGNLNSAYNGTGTVDANGQFLGLAPGSEFRSEPNVANQARSVAAYIQQAITRGFLQPTRQSVYALLISAIPTVQAKDPTTGQYGAPTRNGKVVTRDAFYNLVISNLTNLKR